MNVNLNMNGLLFCKPFVGPLLKSTQDKMERQQECQNKVNFFENQISMLKNMNGETLEDISRKLEMFHNYKDSIDAAKQQYNNEQMFHTLDEAKEKGEKIAEAAEDMKPKTAEERREDEAKEVIDDMKSESSDELTESMEEITEELQEQQIEEQLSQEEQMLTSNASNLSAESQDLPTQVFTEENLLEEGLTKQEKDLALLEYYKKQGYKPVNYYV